MDAHFDTHYLLSYMQTQGTGGIEIKKFSELRDGDIVLHPKKCKGKTRYGVVFFESVGYPVKWIMLVFTLTFKFLGRDKRQRIYGKDIDPSKGAYDTVNSKGEKVPAYIVYDAVHNDEAVETAQYDPEETMIKVGGLSARAIHAAHQEFLARNPITKTK